MVVAGPFELVPADELEPLKPRELAFLHHYLPGCECDPSCQFNQTRAATAIGLSAKTGVQTTGKYLKKTNVQAAIARKMMKLELSTDRVLLEVARLSFVDPGAVYEEDGVTPKNIHDMDPNVRAAISSIEWNEWGPKIRMHSKPETLRLLAKVMDMVRERVSIEGQFDLSVIAEALKRVRAEGPGGDVYGHEFYLPGEHPGGGSAPPSDRSNGSEDVPPGGAQEAGPAQEGGSGGVSEAGDSNGPQEPGEDPG